MDMVFVANLHYDHFKFFFLSDFLEQLFKLGFHFC